MKRIALLLLFVTIMLNCFSQGFINLNKSHAKEVFAKYTLQTKLKTITQETASSLTFSIRDSSVRPVDTEVDFDENGKCDQETRSSSCDSCIEKYADNTLSDKRGGWVKISDTKYVSKFSLKLILETNFSNGSSPSSYIVRRNDCTKKEYKALINP